MGRCWSCFAGDGGEADLISVGNKGGVIHVLVVDGEKLHPF